MESQSKIKPVTDAERERIYELIDKYFVGDRFSIDERLWDDGDAHITVYSTLGTNCNEGYPMRAIAHRQILEYERKAGTCVYRNFVRMENPRPQKVLNRVEIEF